MRSGDCTTFPALMTRIMEDIKKDTMTARKEGLSNGTAGKGSGKETGSNGRGEGGQSLAMPKSVVEEGLRITKECLELVVEVAE
jgi:hypothetical protein